MALASLSRSGFSHDPRPTIDNVGARESQLDKRILPEFTDTDHRFLSWSKDCLHYRYTGLVRVSTYKQADEDYSLWAQAEEIATFKTRFSLDFDGERRFPAMGHHSYGFPYVHVAIERAWNWGPEVLNTIDHAAKTQRILVVCGLDRLSRQSVDKITAKLIEKNIWLLVLDLGRPVEPEEILYGTHHTEEALSRRNSVRAAEYRERHGIGKRRGRPRKLRDTPEDEKTRRLIVMLFTCGDSLRRIASKLNRLQRPPGKWNHKQIGGELEHLGVLKVGNKQPRHMHKTNFK